MRAYLAGHGLRAIAVVSCTVLLAGVSAGAAAVGSVTSGNGGPAVPGGQLWVSRYNGPASGGEPATDAAISVAVSPGGSAVFVTGISVGSGGSAYATVGYDAATGAQLWASRYSGPGNGENNARQVTVSPDGGTVFVTGGSLGSGSGTDYATVAYDAATGAQRWVSRYNGPGNANDEALSLAVSPDGATVFVTGASAGATSGLRSPTTPPPAPGGGPAATTGPATRATTLRRWRSDRPGTRCMSPGTASEAPARARITPRSPTGADSRPGRGCRAAASPHGTLASHPAHLPCAHRSQQGQARIRHRAAACRPPPCRSRRENPGRASGRQRFAQQGPADATPAASRPAPQAARRAHRPGRPGSRHRPGPSAQVARRLRPGRRWSRSCTAAGKAIGGHRNRESRATLAADCPGASRRRHATAPCTGPW